jgi:hypothetical protein
LHLGLKNSLKDKAVLQFHLNNRYLQHTLSMSRNLLLTFDLLDNSSNSSNQLLNIDRLDRYFEM